MTIGILIFTFLFLYTWDTEFLKKLEFYYFLWFILFLNIREEKVQKLSRGYDGEWYEKDEGKW